MIGLSNSVLFYAPLIMQTHASVLVCLAWAIHGSRWQAVSDQRSPFSDGSVRRLPDSVKALAALLLKADVPAAGWHFGGHGHALALSHSAIDGSRRPVALLRPVASQLPGAMFHAATRTNVCMSDGSADSTDDYGGGPTYWNERYAKKPGQFDWLTNTPIEYFQLERVIEDTTCGSRKCKILHVGCGNSKLPGTLYENGYHNIANIDSSEVVISQMQKRHENCTGMTWSTMDATKLEYENDSFDLVIDKSLMDTFACTPGRGAIMRAYLKQVMRVLRPGGNYLCMSYGAPDTRKDFFDESGLAYTLVKPDYTYIVKK